MVDQGAYVSTNEPGTEPITPKAAEEDKPRVAASEVFKYADTTDKVLMIVGCVCALLSGAGMPAFSFVFGEMINKLVENPSDVQSQMAKVALIMTLVGIAAFILNGAHVFCFMLASYRQLSRIKAMYFASILRQDMAWHDRHKPGELTAAMLGDTRVLQNGINDKFSSGILQFGMFIFGFGFGFYSSWELTLVMLGTMPLIATMGAVMAKVMTDLTEQSRAHFASAGAIATEVMENVRTTQVFGQEEFEVERFSKAVFDAETAGIKKEAVANMSIGSTYGIMFSTYTIAFWFSAYLVEWGRNDVGQITATFFSVLMGSFGVGLMFPSITAFTEARAAAFKVYEVIDRVPVIDINATGLPVNNINKDITFRNVKFSYPTRADQVLFTDLNVTIPRGKKVAFSGASGCGKSSIIGLLQRFYDPVAGSVTVDGVDMRQLHLSDWRSLIGIVSQEPSLFSGTVADNVRVGKADATMDEVIAACRMANIHDTIMLLPDQYNTQVGSVGSQLSGGQKQRLAIARAIVKKPKLLILDEATSALDRKSEMEVQEALDRLLQQSGDQMTVVVVAHRLATIRNVDCIYYIAFDAVTGSSIAEAGTFDELMAKKGQFAAMAVRQGAHKEGSVASPTPSTMASPSKKGILSSSTIEQASVPFEKLCEHEIQKTEVPATKIVMMNKEYLWAIGLGLLGSLISGGIYPVYAYVLGRMLNILGTYATNIPELHSQTKIFAPLFIALGAGAFLGWALQAFYGYSGEKLTTRLRVALFRNILRQDQTFFDIPGRDAGSLSGVLSGDCEAVHQLWGPSIGFKVQLVCNIAVGLIIAFVHVWKLALVTLSTLPAMMIAGAIQQMLLVGFGHTTERSVEDTIVTEALTNVRTVISFNLGRDRGNLYANAVVDELPANQKKSVVMGFAFGFTQFSFFGVFALAFWYGGTLVQKGETDFNGVIITTMAVLMGAMGAGEAGGFAAKLNDAQAAAKRVFSVIDRVPSIDPHLRGDPEIGDGCTIDFDSVQFVYPARPKQHILKGMSTQVLDKTTCGLMGQTGCGKSTTVQMLARFYRPHGGEIRINGKPLNSIDLQTWRKNISIVLQEPNLYSGTIRENIRYARLDATDAEIEHVAKLACIHDDILQMPDGYNTDVGYKGRALSGGQKQRVAIARGLLRKPKLLLLDEATSALDNATEAKVQQGIEKAHEENPMTVIAIAHRLTTIRHSDKIILLDEGEIAEEGNHDQLMALNGEYKTRWELFASSTN